MPLSFMASPCVAVFGSVATSSIQERARSEPLSDRSRMASPVHCCGISRAVHRGGRSADCVFAPQGEGRVASRRGPGAAFASTTACGASPGSSRRKLGMTRQGPGARRHYRPSLAGVTRRGIGEKTTRPTATAGNRPSASSAGSEIPGAGRVAEPRRGPLLSYRNRQGLCGSTGRRPGTSARQRPTSNLGGTDRHKKRGKKVRAIFWPRLGALPWSR